MTPKQKAKELIEKFYTEITSCAFEGVIDANDMSIECALLCVSEIIEVMGNVYHSMDAAPYYDENFWQSVKQEIESL